MLLIVTESVTNPLLMVTEVNGAGGYTGGINIYEIDEREYNKSILEQM